MAISHNRNYVPEIRAVRVRETHQPLIKITVAEEAARAWSTVVETAPWYDPDKECVVVFILDSGNWLKAVSLVSIGTVDAALVHPREIFRPAIACAARAVLLIHNHPSGNLEPSTEDLRVTKRVVTAGRIIGIDCLDHIVVGRNGDHNDDAGFLSMKESRLIDFPA
ncbi:MAG: JAB domain-containing protein [Verrucomicrobiota bacterium]